MPSFHYTAINAQGAEKTGVLEGSDLADATGRLRASGFFPTAVAPAQSSDRAARSPGGRRAARIRPKELMVFTRQLGTLLRAGLPLLRGLEILARQQRDRRWRGVLEAIAREIEGGRTLSRALESHPKIFDRLFVGMVRAGEASGSLDVVLDRLARFQEKSLQLRGRMKAALVYPAIVSFVALAILVGLLVFVVPKFKQIFADLLRGAPLPALTRAVLGASEWVQRHYLWLIAAGGLGLAASLLLRRTARGVRLADRLLLALPGFGDFVQQAVVARFARTLGTMLASGVPILPSLLIARDTCGNSRIADAVAAVHDRVREGEGVAAPLAATGRFPALVASMVEIGEQSGQLPEMLAKVADIYEEEVDQVVAGLSAMVEPFLILFLAGVVGTIVIALFLPIIRIVQLLT